ncbi:uncharacterized protein C8A04DRAFT_13308 [Dichotomopilus funicola]|uniref:Ring-like domain-containing protein n=1 Tax=Dichotomopilus funicola TaxID=1934379 RepID=A0AAN6V0S5_9PEZI|nr:hypothetical protein C8A04DRAFT_13308 [Dichotomopilus funicola]
MASFFKKHKQSEKKGKAPENTPISPNSTDTTQPAKTANADNVISTSPSTPGKSESVPLLDDDDEKFLERLVSTDVAEGADDEDGPPPPLPPRPKTPDLVWDTDSDSVRLPKADEGGSTPATATAQKKGNRFSRLFHRKPSTSSTLAVPSAATTVSPDEADREWADLNHMLSRLGLEPTEEGVTPDGDAAAAEIKDTKSPGKEQDNGTKNPSKAKTAALAASAEVQSLFRQFVVVLKDIMRGAPTAVDDLISLLDGRNDVLNRGFEKLPSSMQKLVTQLPKKMTSSLAPELLAAAAEAQGLKRGTDAAGLAKFLVPKNLGDLVLTPAIVKSMLKAIVNALKLRWPAFMGTSVLWSTAVFLLLFVLWYFHKRGKEEREKIEKEAAEALAAAGAKSPEIELEEAGEETEEVKGPTKLIEGPEEAKLIEAGDGAKLAETEGGASSAVVVVEPPVESPRT